MGICKLSQDVLTEYGQHLIDMGTAHGLAIVNGIQRFPDGGGFTCFPHRHGANTMDYVIAQPSFISSIEDLTVGPRPIGVAVDHALLSMTISFQFSVTHRPRGVAPIHYTFTQER